MPTRGASDARSAAGARWRPPTSDAELAAAVGDNASPHFDYRSRSFARKRPPGANDWLASAMAENDLKGQSYSDFLNKTGRGTRPSAARAARDMPTREKCTIYLCVVGDCTTSRKNQSLEVFAAFVQHYFGLPCKLTSFSERYRGGDLTALTDSSDACRKPSQKLMVLNSSRVKLALDETKKPLTDAFALLGLTMHEIAEDGFEAIGEACMKRRVGFVNLKYIDDLRTALRAIAHELGHIFMCEHCVHFECVMNGSMSLSELRRTPLHLCPLELRKIQSSVNHAVGGFELVPRYRLLATFYRDHKLDAEASWAAARATALDSLPPPPAASDAARRSGPASAAESKRPLQSTLAAAAVKAVKAQPAKRIKTVKEGKRATQDPPLAPENCGNWNCSSSIDKAVVEDPVALSSDDEGMPPPLAVRLQAARARQQTVGEKSGLASLIA